LLAKEPNQKVSDILFMMIQMIARGVLQGDILFMMIQMIARGVLQGDNGANLVI
jgi:hypothetical protein